MNGQPLIFGEVLFDCFEDGNRVLGGAPFNVAWHLQAFAARPLFISRVGDDPMGREIRAGMQGWGMSTAALQMDSQHPTGEVRVTLDGGQPSYEILADRAWDHIDALSLPPVQAALVYHGSLGLRADPSRLALEQLLAGHPVPVFMDVNLRDPWWQREPVDALLSRATWVKINDQELDILEPGAGDLQARARRMLTRCGLQSIVVTRGADGAFALQAHGEPVETRPDAAVPVVDTVGAGDAFASVLILGLLRDWPVAATLARAQQFASLLVGQRGATLADERAYAALRTEWGLA